MLHAVTQVSRIQLALEIPGRLYLPKLVLSVGRCESQDAMVCNVCEAMDQSLDKNLIHPSGWLLTEGCRQPGFNLPWLPVLGEHAQQFHG
jgi:hypothetical protein